MSDQHPRRAYGQLLSRHAGAPDARRLRVGVEVSMLGAAGECASHNEGNGDRRDDSHGLREMYSKLRWSAQSQHPGLSLDCSSCVLSHAGAIAGVSGSAE